MIRWGIRPTWALAGIACALPVLLSIPGLARAHEQPPSEAEPVVRTTSAPAPDEPAAPAPTAEPPTPTPQAPSAAVPAPAPLTAAPPSLRPSRQGISLRLGVRAETVREDILVPLTFSGGGLDAGG